MPLVYKDIAIAALNMDPVSDDSDVITYKHFVDYFKHIDTIAPHNLIIGAYFVFGSMQTAITIHGIKHNIDVLCTYANMVKDGTKLSDDQLERFKSKLSNSLIGTSRLLHYINPSIYPAWDTQVATSWLGQNPSYIIGNIQHYKRYIEDCTVVAEHPGFDNINHHVNDLMGYEVTPMRVIEWVVANRKRGTP